MKLLFDKLKTSDGIVRVSFDGEVTWNEYNVSEVKDTGITFTEDDCPDLTKIRIAGAITKISDIKTHIVNESISQDLTTSEQIESLRQQDANIINRFENYLWSVAPSKQFEWGPASMTFLNIGDVYEYSLQIPLDRNIRIQNKSDGFVPPSNLSYPTCSRLNIANDLNTISEITTWSNALVCPLFTENDIISMHSYKISKCFSNEAIKEILQLIDQNGEEPLSAVTITIKDLIENICGVNLTSTILNNIKHNIDSNMTETTYIPLFIDFCIDNWGENWLPSKSITKINNFANSLQSNLPKSGYHLDSALDNRDTMVINIGINVGANELEVYTDNNCFNFVDYLINLTSPMEGYDNGNTFIYRLVDYYMSHTDLYCLLYNYIVPYYDKCLGNSLYNHFYDVDNSVASRLCWKYLSNLNDGNMIKMVMDDDKVELLQYTQEWGNIDSLSYKELEY